MIKHILFNITITLYCVFIINITSITSLHINIFPSEHSYAVDLICISDSLYVKMHLGTPGQFSTIHINTARDISWTSTFFFNNHHSSTLSRPIIESIYFDSYKLSVGKYNDEAVFTNKNTVPYNTTFKPLVISKWFFYYLDEGVINEFETMGMSYKYRNSEFNVIERLYQENKIKHKQFTLINNYYNTKDFKTGVMIIGKGSKIEYNNNKVFKSVCNVITNSNYAHHWGCKLNYIELIIKLNNNNNINNNIFRINNTVDNSYSFFQTNQKTIYAPLTQFNHLANAIISTIGNNNTNECRVNEKFLHYSIQCKCDLIANTFTSITFNIENNIYNLSDIFYSEIDGYCTFIVKSKKPNENVWVFGMDFMNKYDITFDYDNSQIIFYGSDIKELPLSSSLLSHKSTNIYILVNIEIIFLLLSIMMLIGIKYYYAK